METQAIKSFIRRSRNGVREHHVGSSWGRRGGWVPEVLSDMQADCTQKSRGVWWMMKLARPNHQGLIDHDETGIYFESRVKIKAFQEKMVYMRWRDKAKVVCV